MRAVWRCSGGRRGATGWGRCTEAGSAFSNGSASTLQLTPHLHLHLVVPEAVCGASGEVVPVAPADDADMGLVLARVLKQRRKDWREGFSLSRTPLCTRMTGGTRAAASLSGQRAGGLLR